MPPPAVRAWCLLHLLPAEILSIIFLLVIENGYDKDRVRLMLVCRRWYAIVLSTPRILCELRIRKSTTIEMVRAAIQGSWWLLNVIIDIDDESIRQDFNAGAFDASFTAAIEAASRWESLWIYSLPRPGKSKAFQVVPPLKSLKLFYLHHGCDLGSFFGPLMTAITTTATQHLTDMDLPSPSVILFLLQPGCLHVFCSLTTLTIWLPKRMESPAHILPYLQRLKRFTARYLYLPIYPPDESLPLIQTLHYLSLKSVSVQWMAGKVFSVLQSCNIIFPHHIDTICLQPVTMPACTSLTYDSNDLEPLKYFYGLPLAALTVTSGQWNARRGDVQLMSICYMAVQCAQTLTRLDLQIRCSEQLLNCLLRFLPALKALHLKLASPHALSEAFFREFVAKMSNADSPCEMGALPSQPLCLKLVELEVYYERWVRSPERTALLLVLGDIVSSRRLKGNFQLALSVEDVGQVWSVLGHIESIHEVADYQRFVIGISSPHGIISLATSADYPKMELPFKEVEYLVARHQLSIGFLLTLHHLVELRVGDEKDILPSKPTPDLPLFHTLRVLEAGKIHHSFLAGQTFHKLERCRMSLYGKALKPSQDQVTQMPVCTRLDVDDLTLLATLQLPRICELGASFDHPEFNMIWDTHIAVNANLLGLVLLHVYEWYQQADLIQALRCLPVLKSLILAYTSDLGADFFGEFVPMGSNGNSSNEGHKSVILCPMLRSFLVEDFDSTVQPELIPVLKGVVTLRALTGSPLERFTLSAIEFGRKFELIGSQGGFMMEMDSLDENAKLFRLGI